MRGSNGDISEGHALRQREEQIDDSLVLSERNEVERLLESEVGVRRAHPVSGRIVSHHFAGKVGTGAQFEQPLLGFPTRRGLLRKPASDAAGVPRTGRRETPDDARLTSTTGSSTATSACSSQFTRAYVANAR